MSTTWNFRTSIGRVILELSRLRQAQRELPHAGLIVHGDKGDHGGPRPRRYATERYFVTPVSTSVNPASSIAGASASRLAPCVWPNIDSRWPTRDWVGR